MSNEEFFSMFAFSYSSLLVTHYAYLYKQK